MKHIPHVHLKEKVWKRKRANKKKHPVRSAKSIESFEAYQTSQVSQSSLFAFLDLAYVRHKRLRRGIFRQNWARGRIGESGNVENVSTFFPNGERIEKKRKKEMREAEKRGNEEGRERGR